MNAPQFQADGGKRDTSKHAGWQGDSETAWMAPGVGVTATFDYERAGCGSGNHRTYKRNEIEARVHAENVREQYQRNGFTCSPILYRVGA